MAAPDETVSSVASFVSAGIGYIAGLVMAFVAAKYIMAFVILRSGELDAAQRRTIIKAAAGGGFVGILPALLLGSVVGGTLGRVYGEAASRAIGLGSAGIVPGIALGMFVVVMAVMCIAIALGAYLGRHLARG